MKKLALLLSLLVLCSSLSLPASAWLFFGDDSSSEASGPSSSAASTSESEASSASSAADSSSVESASGDAVPDEAADGTGSGGGLSTYQPSFMDALHSKAFYMLNLDSGQPVFELEAQTRIQPASLTKIMTCILALEMVGDPEIETTSLKPYIQNELYNQRVDTLGGIYLNETLTIHDLLYAMMLQSANEAAMMVADYVGDGSIEYFCELMDQKAMELGAYNTHFADASGLSDQSYTTAYDMALIFQYAMENPDFVEIVSTTAYTSQPTDRHPDGISWYTINNMIKPGDVDYYEGILGGKTGSLPDLNIRNYASAATRNGYTYLLVCLGAPDHNAEGQKYENFLPWLDTQKLYDWAFSTFTVKTLMNIGDEVSEVPVRLSWDIERINLLAGSKFATLVPNEIDSDSVEPIPVIPESVDAPVKKGDKVGYVRLMVAGEEIGRVDLIASQNVERSDALYYLDKVKGFFDHFIFKFLLTFVIVVIVLYIALMIVRNHNRRRYKNRRRRPPQQRPPRR